MSTYDDLQPQAVWQIFGAISKIPRGSGNEAAVMTMLEKWAAQHGLETRRDAVGNMLVSIPASPGHEGAASLLIQGHMDMVCVCTRRAPLLLSQHASLRNLKPIPTPNSALHSSILKIGS